MNESHASTLISMEAFIVFASKEKSPMIIGSLACHPVESVWGSVLIATVNENEAQAEPRLTAVVSTAED